MDAVLSFLKKWKHASIFVGIVIVLYVLSEITVRAEHLSRRVDATLLAALVVTLGVVFLMARYIDKHTPK
jgi:hypothetical protein